MWNLGIRNPEIKNNKMIWSLALASVIFLFYLQTGMYVLYKNPGAALNRWFFYLSLYFAAWTLILALTHTTDPLYQPMLWDKVVRVGWCLLPAFLFRFNSLLTGMPRKKQTRNAWYAGLLVAGTALLLAFSWKLFLRQIAGTDPGGRWQDLQPYMDWALYALLLTGGIAVLGYNARWRRQMRWKREKVKFALVFYSLLSVAGLIVAFDFVFPAADVLLHAKLPHVFFIPWFVAIAYGFVRYRFFSAVPSEASRKVMHELRQLLFFCDRNARVILTNPYSSSLTGASSCEALHGLKAAKLFVENQKLTELIGRAHEQGHSEPAKLHLLTLHGEQIPVSAACTQLKDVFGDVYGVAIHGEDDRETKKLEKEINRRLSAEQELLHLSHDLEFEVNARTAELLELVGRTRTGIDQRVKAEEELRMEISEMEVMLEEVHHRVRKNLHIVLSIMEASKLSAHSSGLVQEIVFLQQRLRSILIIHDFTDAAGGYALVDFGGFLRKLADTLQDVYCNSQLPVQLDFSLDDVPLGVEQAIPLSLAVNEVLSDAFSRVCRQASGGHFPTPCIRIVYAVSAGSQYHLSISDNAPLPDRTCRSGRPFLPCFPLAEMLVSEQLGGELRLEPGEKHTVNIGFGV